MFSDKILLITGGTGSFGDAVVKRFLATDVREIRVFSRDELKQEDMRIRFNNPKLKFYIGDTRNYDSLQAPMRGVNFVFHAAALKQVPSCEFYPMEAVRTNELGTENVMNAALANHVDRVVLLSTDKAVYPISAMGMSKAMMEKLMVAKSRMLSQSDTVFCATRCGNVMGSRGSVIPLFVGQIRQGKVLTITDPTMTRFLISLDESVDLVRYAFENGQQGDTLVRKAPATTLQTLVEALKEIFNTRTEIRIIGTRHGEKLYESLVSREEMAKVEDLGRYFRIPADNRDLNYHKYFMEGEPRIAALEAYTSHSAERLDIEGTKALLRTLDCVRG
jgi:UDP-N-acetylglucosamine 4,6-dehydratase/5-epimerase